MIKYLIAFMLFASPCLAGMGIGGFPYPGPGVSNASDGLPSPLFVQGKSVYSRTSAITLDTPVTGGNQLIAIYSSFSSIDATGASIGGGCNTSWEAQPHYNIDNAGANYQKVFLCNDAAPGSNAVTPSSWTAGDGAWYLVEVSGVTAVGNYSDMQGASSTAYTSGDATATATALAISVYQTIGSPSSLTWGSGWTERTSQTTHRSWLATNTIAAAGDYAATGTTAAAALHGVSIIIFE